MWKIGPECAAQQAKCASASVMNCGVRSACATVHSVSGASPAFGGRVARGLRRRTHQEAGRDQQRPGGDADHEHRGAPVIGRDQPARGRRDRHRRDAHAGGDQRDREAAVLVDPARSRAPPSAHRSCRRQCRSARRRKAGIATAPAPGSPPTRPRPSRTLPASTTMRVPKRSDSAPQAKAANPMKRKSSVAAADTPARRPAHRFRNRLQENRQRQHRAEADAGHQRARCDDDPAIVERRGLGGREEAWLMRFLGALVLLSCARGWWPIRGPGAIRRTALVSCRNQRIVSCVSQSGTSSALEVHGSGVSALAHARWSLPRIPVVAASFQASMASCRNWRAINSACRRRSARSLGSQQVSATRVTVAAISLPRVER